MSENEQKPPLILGDCKSHYTVTIKISLSEFLKKPLSSYQIYQNGKCLHFTDKAELDLPHVKYEIQIDADDDRDTFKLDNTGTCVASHSNENMLIPGRIHAHYTPQIHTRDQACGARKTDW